MVASRSSGGSDSPGRPVNVGRPFTTYKEKTWAVALVMGRVGKGVVYIYMYTYIYMYIYKYI